MAVLLFFLDNPIIPEIDILEKKKSLGRLGYFVVITALKRQFYVDFIIYNC